MKVETLKNRQELQKYFSSVLRQRAKSEDSAKQPIDPSILKFFTRKELVHIVIQKFKSGLPAEINLVELEKEELLLLVEDDLIILSYLAQKWIKEDQSIPSPIIPIKETEEKTKKSPIDVKGEVKKNEPNVKSEVGKKQEGVKK